jgi:hypothetical protein
MGVDQNNHLQAVQQRFSLPLGLNVSDPISSLLNKI